MAYSNLNEKANGTRLSRLLVDKGTQAMRNTFDKIHLPSTLAAVLKAKVTQLKKLCPKVVNNMQWDDLYPPSGNPDSKNFDITLLMILLRNICGLKTPASGWDSMPPDADRSVEANIVRIKLFRNEEYAHVTSTELDDTRFENLWEKISNALIDLGIPQHEIDQLKICSLSPKEEIYIQQLKSWKREEDKLKESIEEVISYTAESRDITAECKDILLDVKGTLQDNHQISQQSTAECKDILLDMQKNLQNNKKITEHISQQISQQSRRPTADGLKDTEIRREKRSQESNLKQSGDEEILLKLAKYNFNGNIKSLIKFFHEGSREWLFRTVEDWFADEESRLMILTAGPGVGKSVFAAKVCEMYEKKEKLAACHFCKFNDSNLSNPQRMLESVASHMCQNVQGFKDRLVEQLKRPHEVRSLEDAFRIYLNEPLHNLKTEVPMLIVIDGLDESDVDGKSQLLELIAEEFSKLPEWIKFLITSRPEIPVKAKLHRLNPFEILPNDENNQVDLQRYFDTCLPELSSNEKAKMLLVEKCQGSFLFAFFLQSELNELSKMQKISVEVIERFLPQGIGSVYQKYFRRLESELKILISQLDFRQFLEILVSARQPLPLSFLSGLLANPLPSLRLALQKVNESLSSLLVVCQDLVTVFHKSVVDWLTGNGYEQHKYTIDPKAGDKYLWLTCVKEYEEIKERYPDMTLTNAMKYALDHGCKHLVDDDVSYHIPTDYQWLVDPCIVHVISAVHPKTVQCLRESWKRCLERSLCSDSQWKIMWHFLFFRCADQPGFPDYLQNLINYFPLEMTSETEKSEVRRFLNESISCEKLNSFPEDRCTHFLGGTVVPSNISCIAISPNKKYCAAGREDGMITFLNFPTLQIIGTYSTGLKCAVPCCTFSPDNSIVLYGQMDSGVNVKRQEKSCFFTGCHHKFFGCSFSPSGTKLVTADGYNKLRLWDVETQSLLGLLDAGSPMNSCEYSQLGSFVFGAKKLDVVGGAVEIVGIWDIFTLQRVDRRHPTGSWPQNAPTGSWPQSAFNRKKIHTLAVEIVPSATRQNSEAYHGFSFEVYALPLCAPSGIGCYCNDWPYVLNTPKRTTSFLLCHAGSSWDIVNHYGNVLARRLFSPIDFLLRSWNLFLIVSCDEAVLLQRENQLLAFETPCEQPKSLVHVVSCCFSPDGCRLASFSDDKVLSIWDVNKSCVIQKIPFSCSESVCWWADKYLWMFHFAKGKPILRRFPVSSQLKIDACAYKDIPVDCTPLRFHAFTDGMLVLGCKDDAICVFNVATLTGRNFKAAMQHPVTCACVSPDGSFILLACCEEYEVWKYETTSKLRGRGCLTVKEDLFTYFGETPACCACITRDGKLGLILISGVDVLCHVLDLQLNVVKCLSMNIASSYFQTSVVISQLKMCATSSRLIIASGNQCVIKIIDIDSGKVIGRLDNPVGDKCYYKDIVFHRNENLMAVPNHYGYVDFIKIHFP